MARLENVDVDLIDFEDDRIEGGSGDIETLARNIKENGLLSPVTLLYDGERYTVIAGRRRFRAVKEVLGVKTIPANVYMKGEVDASGASVSENVVRLDMDPVDMGVAMRRMADAGKGSKEIALTLGIPQRRVEHYLRLSRLIPCWREDFHAQKIDIVTAARLAELDGEKQKAVHDTVEKLGYGTWAIRRAIADSLGDTLGRFICEKCELCAKRTRMNDETLFPSEQALDDVCLDHDCYTREWENFIDTQWEKFINEVERVYPDLCSKCEFLPIRIMTGDLPMSEGRILVGGYLHAPFTEKNGYGESACFDDNPEEVDSFKKGIESGKPLFVSWGCGTFDLCAWNSYESREEDSSAAEEKKRETLRSQFASLSPDDLEDVEEKAASTATWSAKHPEQMLRNETCRLYQEELSKALIMGEIDNPALLANIAARRLPDPSLEEFYPGLRDWMEMSADGEGSALEYMLGYIEDGSKKQPDPRTLLGRILAGMAGVSSVRMPLTEKEIEEDRELGRLLRLSGSQTTLTQLRDRAALRVLSDIREGE